MSEKQGGGLSRRAFLTGGAAAAAALAVRAAGEPGGPYAGQGLQVWSCGGLAEGFMPANAAYEAESGCAVSYTGAFAAALGKSLLGGATTEVFAPRVLDLARKLKSVGKMLHYQPLCFTSYVLVTPKGNPAGIGSVHDLARPGLRTMLSPDSSPPGGAASMALLKKAGVVEGAKKNAIFLGSCVQHDVSEVAAGRADAAVVEKRITRLPRYRDAFEIIPIPEEYFPAPPVPFSIGVMKFAKNRELAEDFVRFITSEAGQSHFEAAGFVPALSDEGRRLAKKYGAYDG
ncbi:putative metal-binding protein [Desulfovibrio sp. X2]|uniref:substrate-binding domain-containing protein n=1 Tax=Desulfovibrio sp. X2 TaxID=941449 RepID=UPI000358F222|nr:substrate-binding domain-containing protein [Desulfovibrio sp. X2]EPR43908.1 putative metal-binding protein [Desulfovibrio sp. X2]